MTGPDRLHVHLYGRHVADVIDNADGLVALQYTQAAVAAGAPARLSVALPVTSTAYPSTRGAQRWARSLLPEGRALDVLVTETGVPADDVFSLLSVVGRDVAGAAVIIRPDEDPSLPDARYEALGTDALVAAVTDVGRRPLGLDLDRGVRLSLAGVQDKLLLHRPPRSRAFYRPLHGAASTLILKPEPDPDDTARVPLPGLATNELFCLRLAAFTGLTVAPASVIQIGDRPCLLVERYDRDRRTDPPLRIHQEDLLTASGRDHRLKYEQATTIELAAAGGFAERQPVRSQPGPSLVDLAGLLRSQLGTGALVLLLRAVTFNVAVGNADAHARNYSLLLPDDGRIRMAPLYDLVCTYTYELLTRDAAQRVNGVSHLDQISRADLVAEATAWGLSAKFAAREVDRMLASMGEQLDRAVSQVIANGGEGTIAKELQNLVGSRIDALRGEKA